MYDIMSSAWQVSGERASDLTLEQLAWNYQHNNDKNYYLALAIQGVYPFVRDIISRYYGLTAEDKISFALEELPKALSNYEIGRNTFLTYYREYLRRRLVAETEYITREKRNNYKRLTSYDYMVECGDGAMYEETGFHDCEFIDELESCNLNDMELAYCKLIVATGQENNRYIAKQMGVSENVVYMMRKRLKRKLLGLTCNI